MTYPLDAVWIGQVLLDVDDPRGLLAATVPASSPPVRVIDQIWALYADKAYSLALGGFQRLQYLYTERHAIWLLALHEWQEIQSAIAGGATLYAGDRFKHLLAALGVLDAQIASAPARGQRTVRVGPLTTTAPTMAADPNWDPNSVLYLGDPIVRPWIGFDVGAGSP